MRKTPRWMKSAIAAANAELSMHDPIWARRKRRLRGFDASDYPDDPPRRAAVG